MSAEAWTILSTGVSVASLGLAIIQTFRYRATKRLLAKLNEREQLATWSLYDLLVQAYTANAEARSALREEQTPAVAAIEKSAQTAALLNAMWLNTVEHAAQLEPVFDEAVLDRWIRLGRLDSEWRIARARKLLPSHLRGEGRPPAPDSAER